MSSRSTLHHTFVIERNYPVAPARVFNAFADKEAKSRWFVGPDWSSGPYDFDFRVGGREHVAGGTRELLDSLAAELKREPAEA